MPTGTDPLAGYAMRSTPTTNGASTGWHSAASARAVPTGRLFTTPRTAPPPKCQKQGADPVLSRCHLEGVLLSEVDMGRGKGRTAAPGSPLSVTLDWPACSTSSMRRTA